jgi:creatinine amidohydrolase
VIWDFLQFAHGPFQEVSLNPRPVLLLRTRCDEDEELAGRTQRMLTQVGLTTLHLDLRHSSLLSLLEAETILGALILRLIRELQIDQVNWPSKGRDDPLYGFFRG